MPPRFSASSSAFLGREAGWLPLGDMWKLRRASGNAHWLSSRCLRCIADGRSHSPGAVPTFRAAASIRLANVTNPSRNGGCTGTPASKAPITDERGTDFCFPIRRLAEQKQPVHRQLLWQHPDSMAVRAVGTRSFEGTLLNYTTAKPFPDRLPRRVPLTERLSLQSVPSAYLACRALDYQIRPRCEVGALIRIFLLPLRDQFL